MPDRGLAPSSPGRLLPVVAVAHQLEQLAPGLLDGNTALTGDSEGSLKTGVSGV